MKNNILIWSFGTSDLYLDGKIIDTKQNNFVEKTKEIAENFEKYKDRISFPILEQFIEKSLQLSNDEKIIIKGVFTKQDMLYKTDTYYLKDILEKYVKQKLGQKYPTLLFARNHNIILSTVKEMYSVLYLVEKQYKEQLDNFDYHKVFLNITGGTKGIVLGLLLASLSYFPLSKLEIYYGEQILNTNETVFKKQSINLLIYRQQLGKFIENNDYEGILNFIENNDLVESFSGIYLKAKYGFFRLNCNWEEAQNIYSKLNLPSVLIIPSNIKNIDIEEEMINGIVYTLRLKRFAEFLGRVYNFSDVLGGLLLEKIFGDKVETYNKLKTIVTNDSDLRDYLNNYKVKINDKEDILKWDVDNPNHEINGTFFGVPVKIAILKYFSQKGEIDSEVVEIFKEINELNSYRNKTIIGHGLNPINEEVICSKINCDSLECIENKFIKILEFLNGKKELWINILNKSLSSEIE